MTDQFVGTWKRKSPHQYANDKDKQLEAKAETDGDWTEDTKTGSALMKPTDSENKVSVQRQTIIIICK